MLLPAGCGETDRAALELAAFDYPAQSETVCAPGSRPGAAGRSDGFAFGTGFVANVRTPRNYRPTHAHPLLVVYAGAGQSAAWTEEFTGLTFAATARGYVVAYASSRRMLRKNIRHLATLPAAVAAHWCIDTARVYATGHSDGGTVSVASVLLPDIGLRPAAIAPSAAGFTRADLREMQCPEPVPAFLQQLRDDALFPGYVRELADWLATCNGCRATLAGAAAPCAAYAGCPAHAPVTFCEVPGSHVQWPGLNARLLDFFAWTAQR